MVTMVTSNDYVTGADPINRTGGDEIKCTAA